MAAVDFTKMTPEELDAVLEGPAMAPPDGEVSNFVDPPNGNGLAIAIIAICLVVVVLCLAVRAYARLIILKRAQTQEYLILAAFACFIGWTWGTISLIDSPGYYVHTWNVKLRDTVSMGLVIHIIGLFYSVCLPLLKISILLEWLGLFVPGNRNWFWWVSWGLIGIQIAFAIAAVIALNMVCIPAQKKWEFWLPGKCINAHDIETVSASFQLVSDCIILVLPQKAIWDLQMGWKRKLGVSVIFSLGLFACVSAAFRLAVTVSYAEAADTIYHIGPVCFWAFAEMTCGFIVVCLPCAPKILLESGVWRKLKKGLGMSVTAGATGVSGTGMTPKNRSGSGAMRSKNMRPAGNSYLEIDDTEMKTFQSESTEHLREDSQANKLDQGIVRTTQVTVTQNSDTSSGKEGMYGHQAPRWR